MVPCRDVTGVEATWTFSATCIQGTTLLGTLAKKVSWEPGERFFPPPCYSNQAALPMGILSRGP